MIDSYSPVRSVVRGGRFLALHIDVCVEFAFGRLYMTTAHTPWLAKVGRGVMIGQSVCRLLAFAREAISTTRAMSDR